MNYRVRINFEAQACGILKTGDALGPDVYGSLKMARAALSDGVDNLIAELRISKALALKTREQNLPEDTREDRANPAENARSLHQGLWPLGVMLLIFAPFAAFIFHAWWTR
jgi:hypothetical protein